MLRSKFHFERYERFIAYLRSQVISGYSEMHHIVPRCYGGKDDASNLIRLTARQHFVAHHMLWKAYGGSMARAFFMMSNFGKYGVVNSRTYEAARSEYAAEVSAQFLGKKLGSPSEETRKKQAQAKLGRKLSPEHIEKVRVAGMGRVTSEETKRKISASKKGINTRGFGFSQSEETKLKLRLANMSRPLVTCPHCCGAFKDHGGLKRWHLDNCKHKRTSNV